MAFLVGVAALPARLVHHTGSMIRFTTSQLPNLPPNDVDCTISVPDGQRFDCRFHRHPANPYIGGGALVRWIRSWVGWNRPVDVVVRQFANPNALELRATSPSQVPAAVRVATLPRLRRLAREHPTPRRRRLYAAWERDPRLRAMALAAWPHDCQVIGCTAAQTLPVHLRLRVLEVHHLNHVSVGGTDSPLNICLICAMHHALIHRAPQSQLAVCDGVRAEVRVNGHSLDIRRDVSALW
jgi:hypothetical protein